MSSLEGVSLAAREPVAIVGMACRFPGGASDPDSFWRLLRTGSDTVGEIPPERWDPGACCAPRPPGSPGQTHTRYASLVKGIDQLDADFMGVPPHEADLMDPRQRWLLEVSWEALEDAGLVPAGLRGSRTGVFVGISGGGSSFSAMSGHLACHYGFAGPTLTLDTACSSSLVAVHLACRSLRQRECDLALVGGVNAILSPAVSLLEGHAHRLSPDGRCKTFDAAADGYGRGEGCAVVVLARLADAVERGYRMLALIRGSGVNHNGASARLTVPSPAAQASLIRTVLAESGVEPGQVSYVEAHGTGTPLGDAIEMAALAEVFGGSHTREEPLLVGSVKTSIGHLEGAAGISGLLKAVLMLQRREVPPHRHLKQPSPEIPWGEIPIAVPVAATALPAWLGARPLIGVSSFGFTGTNAHAILEEGEAAPERPGPADAAGRPELLTLSARTPAALRRLAARYAEWLGRPDAGSLADVCYSANSGRSAFAERLAVVAGSRQELAGILARFAVGQEEPRVVTGNRREGEADLSRQAQEHVSSLREGGPTRELLESLGELFLHGAAVSWEELYAGAARRRVKVPTYPFERRRHGLPAAPRPAREAQPDLAPAGDSPLRERLRELPRGEAEEALRAEIVRQVRRVLRLPASHDLNPRTGFFDLGIDSLMAVEISESLQRLLSVRLSPTLAFDHASVEAMTGHLLDTVVGPPRSSARPWTHPAEAFSERELEAALLKKLEEAEKRLMS